MSNTMSRRATRYQGKQHTVKESSTMTGGASYEEVAIDVKGGENAERRVFPSMTKGEIVGQSCH